MSASRKVNGRSHNISGYFHAIVEYMSKSLSTCSEMWRVYMSKSISASIYWCLQEPSVTVLKSFLLYYQLVKFKAQIFYCILFKCRGNDGCTHTPFSFSQDTFE